MQSAFATCPSYMKPAVKDQTMMIERAKGTLAHIRFELFAARGISGAIVAPLLAYALGKRFVIIRKANDGSHDSRPYVGDVRQSDRWIFVDDFIATGATRDAVRLVMKDFEQYCYHLREVGTYLYSTGPFSSEDAFTPA